MGCCVSSNRSSSNLVSSQIKSKNFQALRSSVSKVKASENRAPPPVEEETVKEVLSETPKWKSKVAKFEGEKPSFVDKFEGESKVEKKPLVFVNKGNEISEVSEVYNLSENVSTTTVNDRKEEEEEMRKRVYGSPAKMQKNRSFRGNRRERMSGKSPARRSEQSPCRRNVGSIRVVQSKDQMGNGGTRNQSHRRDASEKSDRQSMSPTTRADNGATRSVVGQSPSARRTSQSLGGGEDE